jgi:hypothetical protein
MAVLSRGERGSPLLLLLALLPWLLLAGVRPVQAQSPVPTALCLAVDSSHSNWVFSGTYPPADPGPTYVRAALVRLLADLLGADAGAPPRLVGGVVFGTTISAATGLVDVRNDQNRRTLGDQVQAALLPSGWTYLDQALAACQAMLGSAPPGSTRHILLLSDGRPDPDPEGQMATMRQQLAQFRAERISLSTVVYGHAAADPRDPARAVMRELAEQGGGKAYLAPAALDLLGLAVTVAADLTGTTASPQQQVTVTEPRLLPVQEVPANAEAFSLTVLRSVPSLQVDLLGPDGKVIAPSSTSDFFLTYQLPSPPAGSYALRVSGQGEVRFAPSVKAAPTPTPAPTASPAPSPGTSVPSPVAAPPAPPPSREEAWDKLLLLASKVGHWARATAKGAGFLASLALVVLLVGSLAWRLSDHLRPKPLPGKLTVYVEDYPRTTYLSDLPALTAAKGQVPLVELLPAEARDLTELPAELSAWTIARQDGALYLRKQDAAEEPPLPLLPGQRTAVPGAQVAVLYHPSPFAGEL